MGLSFKYPKPDYKNQTAKTDDLLLLRSIHEYYQNSNTQLRHGASIESIIDRIRDFYYVIAHPHIRKAKKNSLCRFGIGASKINSKTLKFSRNMKKTKFLVHLFHIDSRQYEFFSVIKGQNTQKHKKLFAYLSSNRAAGLVQQNGSDCGSQKNALTI